MLRLNRSVDNSSSGRVVPIFHYLEDEMDNPSAAAPSPVSFDKLPGQANLPTRRVNLLHRQPESPRPLPPGGDCKLRPVSNSMICLTFVGPYCVSYFADEADLLAYASRRLACELEAEEHRVGVCHLPPPPTIMVILAYNSLWEEPMFVAPPPFMCSTIGSTGCSKLMIRSAPTNLSPYFIYLVLCLINLNCSFNLLPL